MVSFEPIIAHITVRRYQRWSVPIRFSHHIDPSTNEEGGGGIIFGSPHYRAIKQFCICWGIGGNPQFKMVY